MIIALVISTMVCSQEQKFSKEALSYKLVTADKSKISFEKILKKNKGKKTVIEIWAGWCSDCIKAMPRVKQMQDNIEDVNYVFISMDKSYDKWQEAVAKHKLEGDLYWVDDEKLMKGVFGQAINLDWIPRYIVLNEKGEILIYRAIETDFDQIEAALKN